MGRITAAHSASIGTRSIGESGPKVLGVLLLCGPGCSMLQDLGIDQGRKDRFLFGLLNARIVLAAPAGTRNLRGLCLPCSGREAYEWAGSREVKICESLDSFGPLRTEALQGDDDLGSLFVIRPDWLRIDGEPVAEHAVLMMDDIHKLTAHQRELLTRTVIEARSPVGVWIAERFEALSTQEMLASGAHEGREYEKPVEVERDWRDKHVKFEKLTVKIADRRVRSAADTEMTTFRSCLEESLEGPDWEPTFERACREVSSRVQALAAEHGRFDDWGRRPRRARGHANGPRLGLAVS